MKYEEGKTDTGVRPISVHELERGEFDGRMVRGIATRCIYSVVSARGAYMRRIINLSSGEQWDLSPAYETVPAGTTVTLTQD